MGLEVGESIFCLYRWSPCNDWYTIRFCEKGERTRCWCNVSPLHDTPPSSGKLNSPFRSTINIKYCYQNDKLCEKECFKHKAVFKAMICKDMSADYTTFLYHTNVRWLSKDNLLSRVFQLREELAEFFGRQRQEFATYFNDPSFVEHLAYLANIFKKLNTLILSMQGSKITIINLYDSLNAFVEKLELWKMYVMKDIFVMFDRLSSVIRANESINISQEVAEHFCKLEELNHYFPERIVMNENLKIVRNPINANFSSLPVHLQEEFIDLKNDSTMKTAFENSELKTFWCNASASSGLCTYDEQATSIWVNLLM